MTSARKWLAAHNAFHIEQEDSKLARELATVRARAAHQAAGGGSRDDDEA